MDYDELAFEPKMTWEELDWYDIRENNNYCINRQGCVLRKSSLKCLKQVLSRQGYYRVGLWENGKVKRRFVHRLLAEAFIPNPDKKPYINHKDGNRTNNNIENLEWVTARENNLHKIRVLKHDKNCVHKGEIRGKHIAAKPVLCVELGIVYESMLSAEDNLGIARQTIGAVCRGKKKTAGGYHWKCLKSK